MNQHSKSATFIFVMICFIATIPSICSDIFVPSIPAIAKYFDVTVDQVQLTISTLMCSLAISQLFYGPVSAAYGRKKPLIFGMLLVVVGTYVCAHAKSITQLTIGHVLEGLGLGACSLFRAMLRDCYEGKELRVKSSYANLLMTLFYPAAPMIGGQLQVLYGWDANFLFLCLLGTTCLTLVVFLPETNTHRSPDQLKPAYISKVYLLLLTHSSFVGYSLCSMLAMAGYFSWVLSIPLYIINSLHYTPDDLGFMMLIISASSILIGGSLNNRFIHYYSTDVVIKGAWTFLFIVSLLPIACFYFFGFYASWIYTCMWLYFFGTAFLWSNLYTKAFSPFQHLAGQAGSIYGNAQTMGGFFSALLVGYATESNPYGLCAILITVNLLSLLIYFLAISPHQQLIQDHT